MKDSGARFSAPGSQWKIKTEEGQLVNRGRKAPTQFFLACGAGAAEEVTFFVYSLSPRGFLKSPRQIWWALGL